MPKAPIIKKNNVNKKSSVLLGYRAIMRSLSRTVRRTPIKTERKRREK